MAYSRADVAAAVLAATDADYPLILAAHAIADASSPTIAWTTTGNTTDSNAAATNFPVSRIYDLRLNEWTKANASGTTWYLAVNLGTTAAIDTAMVGGHNLGTNSATVVLQIADDATFATNLVDLVTWTPSDDARLVSIDLDGHAAGTPQLYSGVQYLRLKITAGAGFVPEVSEFVVGQRNQLRDNPLYEYDPSAASSEVADFVSRSGVVQRYTFHRAKAVRSIEMLLRDSTEVGVVTSWWSNCRQGTRPFLWIENPATAPTTARWMLSVPSLSTPALAPSVRRWSVTFEETSPFKDLE